MTRWAPDARGRLHRAAVDLFEEQGYAPTTVPQIAERAGLTTRTFFRHFADKREVLFSDDAITADAARLMREAPEGLDVLALVRDRLRTVAETTFEGSRSEVRRVRALIAADPALQERDLQKRAALAEVVRSAFADRGEDPITAALVGDLVVSVLHVALERWLDEPADDAAATPFADVIDEVLAASATLLRSATAGR
ncbi:TetR/AcrR family transcriptional regulator [Amnibacterium setariae]|uniref:TetR family transcriptional regulator n=1 Tax=Amnibacterium setariae TaxID=2306585 RepID=A0A3A1TVG0_9MICO|nr:TetR/AcrR family transcriptional regulator [Amnibacterium setariae]RIX27618.1 TetR family transcriptional regulator [Amnibacterium setariae]